MMTEEAQNQSVPTRYTHTFHFFKINFSINTIHSSLLSIGYLELDSLMKCMFVSHITQRTCFLPSSLVQNDSKSHSLLILHLTFTCQHLTKKLVSFFDELLGCQCVYGNGSTIVLPMVMVTIHYFLLLLLFGFTKLLHCLFDNKIFREGPSLTWFF